MGRSDYTVVVIGSGFGGTMTALPIAHHFDQQVKEGKPKRTVLMLERGSWWTTPVSTVQDKSVATYDFLSHVHRQPVQHWPSQNSFRGFIDIITRCRRRWRNEDGLIELTQPGRTLFGLVRLKNDGVSILRACGVGGGSLVYSNITIRPPELIFTDPRWKGVTWTKEERDEFYSLAREAIGRGVLWKLDEGKPPQERTPWVNTGLSNIVTRTGNINPRWASPDPLNPRGPKHIDLAAAEPTHDFSNALWIDRARVFQKAMDRLVRDGVADEYGAVDLAINDFDSSDPSNQYDGKGRAKNYCERQGRCNVGCLPGARHTLNKQLMQAIFGQPTPPGTPPVGPRLPNVIELWPLVEVDVVVKRPGGGYEIKYVRQDAEAYLAGDRKRERGSVTADVVIMAAGCVGTNEIMLRSRKRNTIPNLSDQVGEGFSTNGDYIAFLERTKERVSLVRGPVTTSSAHFNTTVDRPEDDRAKPDHPRFHILEDQGIPPALSSLVGVGVPFIRSLSKGRPNWVLLIWSIILFGLATTLRTVSNFVAAFFTNPFKRPDTFQSEDELTARMMCVVAAGREQALGQFTLGQNLGATTLRLKRRDKKRFWEDPVYSDIKRSLDALAKLLAEDPSDSKKGVFRNPFLSPAFGTLGGKSIASSHPLGGCRIGTDGHEGVVDEYGRVFEVTSAGARRVHKGLYIADGSIIPTALGVNPSLTISALALRIAKKAIEDIDGTLEPAPGRRAQPGNPELREGEWWREGPRDMRDVKRIRRSAAHSLLRTHLEPQPANPLQYLTSSVEWISHYLSVAFHQRHAFRHYAFGNGIFTIPNDATIALAADWGTGTAPAYKVAMRIEEMTPDVTMHMGDVYYSGTPQEYRDWFLGKNDWPHGKLHTFAMNANHEMYSGGHGYFDTALDTLRQEASFFCLENEHWRVLGLDSGYYSGILPLLEFLWHAKIRLHEAVVYWLREVVFHDSSDRRPVIALTHHQPFSAFNRGYRTLWKNLTPYLDRVLLWLWGHEHRFAGYGPVSVDGLPIVRGRCIGHGGMPIELDKAPSNSDVKKTNLVFYDNRIENELSKEVGQPVGYCGFAFMHLNGPVLTIDYIDENGKSLLQEWWDRSSGRPVGKAKAGDERLLVLHPQGLNALVQPARVREIVPA
jgi:choline dehydrogenase-like flavoprotein